MKRFGEFFFDEAVALGVRQIRILGNDLLGQGHADFGNDKRGRFLGIVRPQICP